MIILNHIIEHTQQGLKLIKICGKYLANGGLIYIEWPSTRSIYLPSLRGTLNFFDDKTHIRLYSIHEVINVLIGGEISVIKAGKRCNIYSIMLMIPRLIQSTLTSKSPAGAFWDILGFADFVLGQKK